MSALRNFYFRRNILRNKINPSLLVMIAGNLICPILFFILSKTIPSDNYALIIIDNAAALSTLVSITSTTIVELMPTFFKTGLLLFGIKLFNMLVLRSGNYSESGFKNFIFNVCMLLPTVVVSILISMFLNVPFIDSAIHYICDIRSIWTSFLHIFSSETFLIGLLNIVLTIWGIIRLAIFFVVAIYPIIETIAVLIVMLISIIVLLIISVIVWIFGYGFGTLFTSLANGLNSLIVFCEGFGLVFGAIAMIICFITIDNIFVVIFKKIDIEKYTPQYILANILTDAILGK